MQYTGDLDTNQLNTSLAALPDLIRPELNRLAAQLDPVQRKPIDILCEMASYARYSEHVEPIVSVLSRWIGLTDRESLDLSSAIGRATAKRLVWRDSSVPAAGVYAAPARPATSPPAGQPGPGETPRDPEIGERETRIDPEIGRLSVPLHRDSQLRLWCILRDCGAGRGGWQDKGQLYKALSRRSHEYTWRHFNRLLAAGLGVFFDQWPGDRIALIGSERVARTLTRLAADERPEVVATNRPGVSEVVIPLGDNLQQWRGHLYGAWLAAKDDPIISRAKLAQLWGVSEQTLLNWERQNPRIRIARNYGQVILDSDQRADQIMDYLPSNASVKRTFAWDGRLMVTWREPNTYHASYRQLAARYRAGSRRAAANTERPATNGVCGQRLFFADAKRLRQYNRRRGPGAGMVWRGENRRGSGIWELSTGDVETGPQTRAVGPKRRAFVAEYNARLARIRADYASGHFFDPLTGSDSDYANPGAFFGCAAVRGVGGTGGAGRLTSVDKWTNGQLRLEFAV